MENVTPSTQSRATLAPLLRVRALLVASALLAFSLIWIAVALHRPLAHPDEGRYAEIPREMLTSGQWVTPHLNGLAYLEKPPLQYWATALAYRVFGVSEGAARLWTLLCAWLDVVLVYFVARRLWSSRVGAIAAVLLASSVLHFAMGQILTLDMSFTFLLTAALCAFCLAQTARDTSPGTSGRWMLATWLLLALAVLTKGIVALLIAGTTLSIYVLWHRDWRVLRTLRPVTGALLFLVVTLPWFIQVSRENSDFLQFFFIREHFERYLTDVEQRVEPWWYFGAVFVLGALPWLPQMGSALLGGWRTGVPRGRFDPQRLLWIWCVFILVFFSLSDSKLAPYILPMFPALALLTAARESHRNSRALYASVAILVLFGIVLLACCLAPAHVSRDPSVVQVIGELRPVVFAFVAVVLTTAVIAVQAIRRRRFSEAMLGMAAASFLGLAMLFGTVGQEPSRSGITLAAKIPAELAAHAPLFSVQTYDQTIPFYLRRTMVLVDTRGELDYGLNHAPGAAWDMPRFEASWPQLPQAVAVMSHETYQQLLDRGLPMRLLGEDKRRVAVSRR